MTRLRRHAVLFPLLLMVGITVAAGLWLRAQQRQYALDRQLVDALITSDTQQALVLVNAGADPNTPYKPVPPPSLRQLWNYLLHRSALPIHDDSSDFSSAFTIACGEDWMVNRSGTQRLDADAPQLVETMIQHGARKNAKAGGGWTPLMRSVDGERPKTVEVLLRYGVDVNAQDQNGYTALVYVLMFKPTRHHFKYAWTANYVRQLLAHGANPNLPDHYGSTPLQEAQKYGRADLVDLMQQAGAKR